MYANTLTLAVRRSSDFCLFALALSLAACGGGGGGGGTPAPTYTVGGTVTGLAGTGLVIQNNGGDNVAIPADGAFSFPKAMPGGGTYSVTVLSQPSNLSQTCTVSNGSGTIAGANIGNVGISCTTNNFTVGGMVSGHNGSGLTLRLNGTTDLLVAGNGTFAFGAIVDGSAYSVAVSAQPLGQTCAVGNGSGTLTGANVVDVAVTCVNNPYTVGGNVTGLAGTGLVLRNNGGDNLSIGANGTFTFSGAVASGAPYSVTVLTQPTNPSQTCTVSNGSGTVGAANITGVGISCSTNTFTVGGTVSGLAAGASVTLQNNGGNSLPINANGAFTFSTPILSGATYAVTVLTQPSGPTQTCTVTAGSGTVGGANVTGVAVNCVTNTYTIGGSVSGLVGSGLVLRNNGSNLPIGANGTFTFTAPVASGATYAVTVFAQPGTPTQTCTVTGGSGTVVSANVTSVLVSCTTNSYTIGVNVTGLVGTGLKLQNNGGNDLPITGNTTFTFTVPIQSGQTYSVTVLTQPTGPTQTCTVANGSGTVGSADVTLNVNCFTNAFTVSVTVTGLDGTGLQLQNNGGDTLDVATNGQFTFATPVASGANYLVTVFAQPIDHSQTCTVTNGSGTIAGANVTNVGVNCVTKSFLIKGTVTGHLGTALVLRNNGGDDLSIPGNGQFTFATPIQSGLTYSVTVLTQPTGPSQTCTITNGSGTVANGDVTNVAVNCATNSFTIGGSVTGVAGGGLIIQNNGANDIPIAADGSFTFSTSIQSGLTYAVTVKTQPTNLSQTCTVTNGSGTVGAANVTNVSISCVTNSFTVGGTVSGENGTGLTLKLNGATTLSGLVNGSFAFPAIPDGTAYTVTVFVQPLTQTCTVSNGSGTLAGANLTNIAVVCTDNLFSIGGNVTGLAGTGLVLRNNGGDDKPIAADGAFAFTTKILQGTSYAVTVLTQPSNPTQTCTVTNGSGTANADVTTVAVNCVTNTYTINVNVTGLAGAGLVLQNNGGNDLPIGANGTSSFTTKIASSAGYAVSVLTQPASPTQTCLLTNASGTVTNADISNVAVNCTTNTYTVGGNVSGLAGTGLVLRNNGGDDKTIGANGAFTFTTPVASGATYAVTVLTQPSSPTQTCTVGSGSGTVTNANIANVAITCFSPPAAPAVSLAFGVKELQFSWGAVAGADFYRLKEDPDGASGFTQVGTDLVALSVNHVIPVYRRVNAKYIVQACNIAGCTDSATQSLSANLTEVIGYFKASNTGAFDAFGSSIALSSDGNTLAIGAPAEDSAAQGIGGNQTDDCAALTPTNCAVDSGAVYVFTRSGGAWSQQAYVKASNTGTNDHFGYAVALSGDGNTLAVGAVDEDSGSTTINSTPDELAPDSGAVYVFSRSGSTWSQQAYVKASNAGLGDEFGSALALSSSGDTLAVGAWHEGSGTTGVNAGFDDSAPQAGAVYVFARNAGTWSQQAYVKASNTDAFDEFGVSVALSGDGDTLAVGARHEDGSLNSSHDSGAVYVYTRTGTVWASVPAYLKASNAEADDVFGASVALSSDGNTLAVGAWAEDSSSGATPADNSSGQSGAAYVFTRSGGIWSEQAYVKASNTQADDRFGIAVAISGDGNTLAVGAHLEDGGTTGVGSTPDEGAADSGAVYVFTRSGSTWSQKTYVKASNTGSLDQFGLSVVLSGDGNTLAVGAIGEDSGATGIRNGTPPVDESVGNAGAVYLY